MLFKNENDKKVSELNRKFLKNRELKKLYNVRIEKLEKEIEELKQKIKELD